MQTVVASNLIDRLRDIQTKEGLSDHKFAKKLSISYQLWQMTRTGNRDVGLALAKGIVKAYPRLIGDVLIFLGADVVKVSGVDGELSRSAPQTTQNRHRDVFSRWGKVIDLWLDKLMGFRDRG